eukprot:TRINITY_DN3303_c0_g1_i1.p1 TRINITY_DN3303_c0_g1~~TRINITY_DN3303_c0_g1_i1.p1  ORF type:complete len:244 (-),score=22.95 TRINITY_DN3303_c0_g1_i1:150-881(-)
MVVRIILFNVVCVFFLPYFLYKYITDSRPFRDIFSKGKSPSIKLSQEYQEQALLDRVWSTSSGEFYRTAVEYQPREGLCGITTIRCVLKSVPGFSVEQLPPVKGGSMTAETFASKLDSISAGKTTSTVVLGSEGYEKFISTLKKLNDPKFRVSVNFLRSSLFGLKPFWVPTNLLLNFCGGHFSPIIAYLEEQNLAAVYDVNASFSLYLVDAERLFQSVNTVDIMSGQTRALILTEVKLCEESE